MKDLSAWRPTWPGQRLTAYSRMVRGKLQVFYRLPRSNVPMYALKRGKGTI